MCDSGFDSGSDISFGEDGIGEEFSDSSYDVGEGTDAGSELDSLSLDFETAPETLDITNEPEIFEELPPAMPGDAAVWDMSDVPSFEEHLAEMEAIPEMEAQTVAVETDLNEMLVGENYDIPHEEMETVEIESLDDFPSIDEHEITEDLSDSGEEVLENEIDDLEFPPNISNEEAFDESGAENIEHQQTLSIDEINSLIDNAEGKEELLNLRDALVNGQIKLEDIEDSGNDVKTLTLTRDITPELLESRAADTKAVLDDYRDTLRGYNVSDDNIEEFVAQEREKINAEYDSLDHGDTSSNIYYQPTDWQSIAQELNTSELELYDGPSYTLDEQLPDETITEELQEAVGVETEENGVEQLVDVPQDTSINYESIYDSINSEALGQGFEDIQIDEDAERLDTALENFGESTWENLSFDEQKTSMQNLADYVVDVVGFDNPPSIEYYNNPREGDYGGYDPNTNTLNVNEYMLYNSNEAADTIAHELWHAHQYECASNPHSALDYQYQYNFDNYIKPEFGQEAYEAQLVEAEARAFAAQFKDRLLELRGRRR